MMVRTVRIWKNDNTYKGISILKHDTNVTSILKLKGKEVLVESGFQASTGISFWNLNDYTKLHAIKGYGVDEPIHIIQLSNGNIALSSQDEPHPIVIIDSSTYQVKKVIQLKEHITGCSSFPLCVFNEHSFIYVSFGIFLQISNKDGSILFHSDGGSLNEVLFHSKKESTLLLRIIRD